jgi:hypothetical protein
MASPAIHEMVPNIELFLRSVFLFFGGGGLTQAKKQDSLSDAKAKASPCGAFASHPADFN